MFIVVQFPFTDVRGFLPFDAGRLQSPTWLYAEDGKEFVRGHGAVRRRVRGGIDQWAGERLYCETARALLFDRWPRTFRLQTGTWFPLDCAFRRFFTDGQAMGRVEVGVSHRTDLPHPAAPEWARPIANDEWPAVCPEVLQLAVRVRMPDGTLARTTLVSAGPLLAKHYLRATTKRPAAKAPEDWWYTAGAPLAIVEYEPGELPLTRHCRPVRSVEMAAIALSYQSATKNTIGTWFLENGANADRDILRRLRIHLVRLHAERECFKRVLQLIAKKQLAVADTDPPSPLADYLEDAAIKLRREWRDGLPQGDILRVAYDSATLVSEGERADLLSAITTAKRPLQRRVAAVTSAAVVFNIKSVGGISMTDKSQTITNSTITNSNLVIGDAITNVATTVQASQASDPVKEALVALTKAVEQMAASLPEARQQEVVRDLRSLAEEATSPTPRRKWYEVSAEGLLDAAKSVAALGGPVTQSVKVLLDLLSGSGATV